MIVAVALFYGMRAILQGNFSFRYINRTYWTFPGIPSIVVPYGDTADFYYSGHTGFMFFAVLYLLKYRYKLCAFIAFLAGIFVVQSLLIFRLHYSIGKQHSRNDSPTLKFQILTPIFRLRSRCSLEYLLLPHYRKALKGYTQILQEACQVCPGSIQVKKRTASSPITPILDIR